MARTVTLASLRTQVRQRADMEHSGFVSDSELNTYINQSIAELYDLLVTKYGNDYYLASPYMFTTNTADDRYPLPADFLKLAGVDLVISADYRIALKPFMFQERNRLQNFGGIYDTLGRSNIRYRVEANEIVISPKPDGAVSLWVWYVPCSPLLVNDSDTFDGFNGWEEYVVIDAAIKAAQKEESDVQVLFAQKAAMMKRIEEAAENRDQGATQRVIDVYRGYNNGQPGYGDDSGWWS